MQWVYLSIAILSEVIATSVLKAENGFTIIVPPVIVVIGYAIAFYFLSLTLRTMSAGIAYAVWAGAGVILVALIAVILNDQHLDLPAVAGIALIVSGVPVLNLFFKNSFTLNITNACAISAIRVPDERVLLRDV
jgi:small multidrug resistance pump